jgi:hypothetical protein
MTSRIVSAIPQVDGRISVQEEHILDDGSIITLFILADPDQDLAILLAEHAQQWQTGM